MKKIATSIATAGIVAAAFAPAAFADNITVSGNGALSNNSATVSNLNVDVVEQSTKTEAVTFVGVVQNTGGNSSSFNTGGKNNVTSGAAVASVGTTVSGGSNTATVAPSCGCVNGPTTIKVSKNGALSVNKADVKNANVSVVSQKSKTQALTGVGVIQNTGFNSSSFNTGGSNTVTSSGATAGVGTVVTGGSNTLN